MRCDKIYVMDKGEFVESGTHHELMDKRGLYYDLWKEQLPETNEIEKEAGIPSIPIVPFVGGVFESAAAKEGEGE
jgi:ATP-binding cassette subfamily B protein